MKQTVITGTGSYIPANIVGNADFQHHRFYTSDRQVIETSPQEVAKKFEQITGIRERRYVTEGQHSSDIALEAAQVAIKDSGIDPETIDQIIFAHNFGDVRKHTIQTDVLPALAARLKHGLNIQNPRCVAYDVLFGCPGWIQGVIQADAFFKAGMAKTALVVGSETLSRVLDHYDRDSMIFADGAGACILEYKETEHNAGILSSATLSHTQDEAFYLYLGSSNFPDSDERIRYIKMNGRKVYEYALKHVPDAMKDCLEKAEIDINDLKKVFIHQANEKLDEAVIHRFYKAFGMSAPEGIMPMSVHELGNSSVATVPTLYDRVRRGKLEGHSIEPGDVVMLASVGSGMNINAITYRV